MLGTSGRNDVNSLGAITTCCAGAFTSFRVQIAYAISRTGVPISPTADAKQKTPPLSRQGFVFGTSGRTRTGTLLRAGDFESPMSTNSITLAF